MTVVHIQKTNSEEEFFISSKVLYTSKSKKSSENSDDFFKFKIFYFLNSAPTDESAFKIFLTAFSVSSSVNVLSLARSTML